MKSRVMVCVMALLSCLFMAYPVSATTDTVVSINAPTTGHAGNDFSIDVVVSPGTNIAGGQFNLSYNPSLVTFNGITEGNLFKQNGALTYFMQGQTGYGTINNVAAVILGAGQSVSTSGIMATVHFTAISSGVCTFTLTNVIVGDTNGQSVPIIVNNGQTTVNVPSWDVNNDGVVNLQDVLQVLSHFGEIGSSGWIRDDVNTDGVVNILDIVIVGQHWLGI